MDKGGQTEWKGCRIINNVIVSISCRCPDFHIHFIKYSLLCAIPAVIRMKLKSSYGRSSILGSIELFTRGPRPSCPESPRPLTSTWPFCGRKSKDRAIEIAQSTLACWTKASIPPYLLCHRGKGCGCYRTPPE